MLRTKTICLNMIVKNESKIIIRCLDSLEKIIDFASITDTGSTDGTIQIFKDWFKSKQHIKLVTHEKDFTNFCGSRNDAFLRAQEDFESDYILFSDADFVWEADNFDKRLLFGDGFYIKQMSSIINRNIRLVKSTLDWNYKYVTHEIVNCENAKLAHLDSIKIKDMYDGGCKSDKFTRDIRLITEAIEGGVTEEEMPRYTFYLAQSYRCAGMLGEAIVQYKKRLEYDGYLGEKYVSMRELIKCYGDIHKSQDNKIFLDDEDDFNEVCELFDGQEWKYQKPFGTTTDRNLMIAVLWGIRSHKFDQTRAEGLFELIKLCRIYCLYDIFEEWWNVGYLIKQPLTSSNLWIEPNCYQFLFEYEMTIVGYYLNEKYKKMAKEFIVKLLEDDRLDYGRKNIVINNCSHYN